MYLYVCMHIYMSVYTLPVRNAKFIRAPGINWIWKLWNTWCGSWDPSSGLLEEKLKPLTAELSFCQSSFVFILFYIYLKTKALHTKLEIVPGINSFPLEIHYSDFI